MRLRDEMWIIKLYRAQKRFKVLKSDVTENNNDNNIISACVHTSKTRYFAKGGDYFEKKWAIALKSDERGKETT